MTLVDSNEEIVVKETPLFGKIYCTDGVHRTSGRLRVDPIVIEKTDFEYPFEKLANQPPTAEGIEMFNFNEFGLVFNELHLAPNTDKYTWDTLWLTTPKEYKEDHLPQPLEKYSTSAFYAPTERMYAISYVQEDRTRKIELIDLTSGTVEQFGLTELSFFEVPDQILYDALLDEYSSVITTQLI